jgi:hypothetical protein
MVMVLPFATAFIAGVLAFAGRRRAALGVGLATVVIQVAWLFYHATDKLAVSL